MTGSVVKFRHTAGIASKRVRKESMKTIVEEMIAGRKLTIETGRMAKQAHGSVYIQYGDSSVLVAACSEPASRDLASSPHHRVS